MANIPLKTITFPELDDTYTVTQVDDTLTTAGKAADAKKTGDELSALKADLGDNVNDLKSTIQNGNNNFIYANWERGAIINATGMPTASGYDYRIRTADFVTFADHITFVIDPDYELAVFTYDNVGEFISTTFHRYSYVTPINVKTKYSIKKITEDVSVPAVIGEFYTKVRRFEITYDGLEYLGGEWCNGNIDYSSGGYYNNNAKRLSTPYFVEYAEEKTFEINSGYILAVNKFDVNGVSLGTQNDYSGTFSVYPNVKYRFVIRKSDESSDTIATQDFRKQIFKSVDSSIGVYRQNLSVEKQLTAFKNLGDTGLKNVFAPMAKFTKNLYDPFYLKRGFRANVSDGKEIATSDYDMYSMIVPPHKQIACSCVLDGNDYRSFNYAIRSHVVYNLEDTMISSNNSDYTSYNYVNTTDNPQIIRLNIWSDTNSTHTVTDFMVEVFDETFNLAGYLSEYIPYGMELEQKYTHMLTGELHYPRDYFESEINDTVTKVQSLQSNVNYTFAFVTDTHYDPTSDESHRCTVDTFSNLKFISELVPINALYHGGDWLYVADRTQAEANAEIAKMRNWMLLSNVYGRVHLTPGNHDGVNGYVPDVGVLYSPMMTHDEIYVERVGDNYNYYIDIKKPKLRMVMLNDCNPSGTSLGVANDSLAWLTSTLNSTPVGANIIIISHIGPQSEDFILNKNDVLQLLNSWNNHTGDYVSNTGKIVAWIVGHQHYDWVVPSSYSGCDFPVIVNTCSFRNAVAPTEEQIAAGAINVPVRTYKTELQDSWTVFVYRPDLGTISGIRFGAGSDTEVNYINWD